MYNVHCTAYIVRRTMYDVHSKTYIVRGTMYVISFTSSWSIYQCGSFTMGTVYVNVHRASYIVRCMYIVQYYMVAYTQFNIPYLTHSFRYTVPYFRTLLPYFRQFSSCVVRRIIYHINGSASQRYNDTMRYHILEKA